MQTDTKMFHDIATQSGSIPINKKFKIHKKFSKVDLNGLISEFYSALDNQGQLTDFVSLATDRSFTMQNTVMHLRTGTDDC